MAKSRSAIRPLTYDYVRRMYGVDPQVGQQVRHLVTNQVGSIARPRSPEHYVHVRFDGSRNVLPCHPTELEYSSPPSVSRRRET